MDKSEIREEARLYFVPFFQAEDFSFYNDFNPCFFLLGISTKNPLHSNNFILKETACSIFGDESLLLDVEKQVLSLKIMGYSIAEISRKLKINRKKVEYIIKISREKVKQIL